MQYTVFRLSEHPELLDPMADWFSSKWGIPREAYVDSMRECLCHAAPVPEWYVMCEGSRIVGGLGVIANDFHPRTDLTPNVCAVYTEPDCRGRGIAGALLDRVCSDMASAGIPVLYLLTDHNSFYERYGWKYLCPVIGDGEEEPSRMYVHR